jgi:rubredoxin
MFKAFFLAAILAVVSTDAFTIHSGVARSVHRPGQFSPLRMSEDPKSMEVTAVDPMEEAMEELDSETLRQMEKARKVQELREQEVFMKKSTGKHQCSNCDWEYDETKGDSMMIGGMNKPGTTFSELPADWRCPVCRASKDAFVEVVEEIPGFEVNQGYGFGTNSWTSGQKNLAVFGGLAAFFVVFLGGYALS